MNRLSNHGQTLSIFVVFLPLFIMLGTLGIELGFVKYNKGKLNELNKMVVRYGMMHIEQAPYNEMVNLIYKNDSEIDDYKIDIDTVNKVIKVDLKKTTKGFFKGIVGKKLYKEKSSYVGRMAEERIIIEEGAK